MQDARLPRDLIARINETAAANGDGNVATMHVWLGALSRFAPDHFGEHFRAASVGTPAATAVVTCEISDDPRDPDALWVRLLSIELGPA